MDQIVVKSGKALLENVPQPLALPGTVLVKVAYSCISQGTEISGVKNSGKSKIEKTVSIIKEKPRAIQKAIDLYKEQGDNEQAEAYYVAATEAAPGVPTGYLRMATMAREREDRDGVVYWNDLARQAVPGGLLRPEDQPS